MVCPEIAQNVQISVLTDAEYDKESYKIYYDMANFDNIFTKKYRRWYKEGQKDFDGLKSNTGNKIDSVKERHYIRKEEKKAKKEEKMKIKAEEQQYKEVKPTNQEVPNTFEPKKQENDNNKNADK